MPIANILTMSQLLRTSDGEIITLIPILSFSETAKPFSSASSLLGVSAIAVATSSSTLLLTDSLSKFLSPLSTTRLSASNDQKVLPSASYSISASLIFGSISTAFSIEPEASSVNLKSSTTKKNTKLIVGLTLGISFFLVLLVMVICFFFRKQRFISIDKKPWNNHSMLMDLENKKDHLIVKRFKLNKIRTPIKAYNNWDSREESVYWKVPTIPSSKNSTLQNSLTSKGTGSLSRDTHRGLVLKELENKEGVDVETFLYTDQCNIKSINTDISLRMSASALSAPHSQKKRTFPKPLELVKNEKIPQSKWTYLSPFSKWFLRSSTYFQDSEPTSSVEKTLSVDLKTLKLLCEKRNQNKQTKILHNPKLKSRHHLIDINTESNIKMFQKPLPDLPNGIWKKSQVSSFDSTVSTGIKDSLYMVIKDYEPQLLDEIEIHISQFVKLLAVHSEEWVLVTNNIKEMKYMNDSGCNGLVPMICLKKLQ